MKLHKSFLYNAFHQGFGDPTASQLASRIHELTEGSFITMRDTCLQESSGSRAVAGAAYRRLGTRQAEPAGAALSLSSGVVAFVSGWDTSRRSDCGWTIDSRSGVESAQFEMGSCWYVVQIVDVGM